MPGLRAGHPPPNNTKELSLKQRKKIPLMKHYENDTLDDTWRRLSRHMWQHKYQYRDPRFRRLEAARVRRAGFLPPVLCDCTDDDCGRCD